MAERRRRITKVERYGAEGVVDPILRGGGTIRQACDAFKEATGEPIGEVAMMNYRQNVLRRASEKMRQTEMLVDRLLAREDITYEGLDPGEAVADFARRMLLTRAVEAVIDLSPKEVASLTPEQLSRMISRLDNMRISGERLRLQYDRAFTAAKEAIFTQIEEEMREHPDLFQKVRAVADAALARAEKRTGGLGSA